MPTANAKNRPTWYDCARDAKKAKRADKGVYQKPKAMKLKM